MFLIISEIFSKLSLKSYFPLCFLSLSFSPLFPLSITNLHHIFWDTLRARLVQAHCSLAMIINGNLDHITLEVGIWLTGDSDHGNHDRQKMVMRIHRVGAMNPDYHPLPLPCSTHTRSNVLWWH